MSVTITQLLAAAFLSVLIGFAGSDRTASAEPLNDTDGAAIRSVISGQMEAFQQDDWSKAFGYAAPSIRLRFGSIERFASMVVKGYAPVWRPREVHFEDLKSDGGNPRQDVYVVGPDGVPVIATYVMERQEDGSWRIAGVYLREIPDKSV